MGSGSKEGIHLQIGQLLGQLLDRIPQFFATQEQVAANIVEDQSSIQEHAYQFIVRNALNCT